MAICLSLNHELFWFIGHPHYRNGSKPEMNLQMGRIIWIVMLSILLVACGGGDEPLEVRVQSLIDRGRVAAEEHDMAFFREMIDPAYSDVQGNDRAGLLRLLTGYFYRNRSIYLVTRTEEIVQEEKDRVRAVVYVGMAGSPVEGFEQVLSLRADLYRLEMVFSQGKDLRLVHAQWQRASPEELFTEQ
jgi:hypothetical protein